MKKIDFIIISVICIFLFTTCENLETEMPAPQISGPPIELPNESAQEITEQFISSQSNSITGPWYCSFIEVNDGWIATGSDLLRNFGKSGSVFIAKFDKTGKNQWERFLSAKAAGSLNHITSLMEVSDGYIFQVDLYSDARYYNWVKYGKDGSLLWVKNISLHDAVPNDTGFMGIVNQTTYQSNNAPLVVQFDTNGEIIWKKNVTDGLKIELPAEIVQDAVYTESDVFLFRIFDLPNGGYLVRGRLEHKYKYNTPQYDMIWGTPIEFYTSIHLFAVVLTPGGEVTAQSDQSLHDWGYSEILVTDTRIIAMGLRSVKIYDFNLNFIKETPWKIEENHYYHSDARKKANKIGDNYFTTGYFSDGSASAFVLGLNSDGDVVWDIPRHNGAGTGTEINYHGALGTTDGIAVLASYRVHEKITLHFLYYNLNTKTFIKSDPLL